MVPLVWGNPTGRVDTPASPVIPPGEGAGRGTEVHERRKILQLLADDEAYGRQHGHAAVRQLRLAPAAQLPHTGRLEEAGRVENTGEGRRHAGQGLGVCTVRVR